MLDMDQGYNLMLKERRFTKVNTKTINVMEKVLVILKMEEFILEDGKKTQPWNNIRFK